MPIFLLSDEIKFPPPQLAQKDGLLAAGGDLSRDRLLLAYKMGIFPWYSEPEPVLWWSPDPRLVLYPDDIKISKTLKKIIHKNIFHITIDQAFRQIITSCARIRSQNNEETWIVDDMIKSYCKLHESGFAHSVEAWHEGDLAGGLYGVSLGRCFFGESMFTRISNASNVAFVFLVEYLKSLSFDMIDCQVSSEHLIRFGAKEIPRERFLRELEQSLEAPTKTGRWG
ncbi:MAG: leucyl/phenylalanyl-tRNA--protein transferase [Deltaproteobacteria bacterium]|nr:leucyl/phenylalanyl-tRNA--protein transferase [Deltaproteobacteria bacterium]MBW2662176.1 leucyl/phenylalanyl-tRNA--protein transferase [Deltaproteobacteria bacterium]